MATPSRILDKLEDALDALEAGDLEAVEGHMRLPRRKGAASRERLLVEGQIAGETEGPEAALAWYAQAVTADPTWWCPHLEASREHLALEAPEEALAAAHRALERLDDDDVEGWLDLGEVFLVMGELEEATRALARGVELAPSSGDAWHALGAALHELGAEEEATNAWLRVRELDRDLPRPRWALSATELETLAERTLAVLPPAILERLANVPILVQDAPSEAQVRDGIDPRLLGLFTGVPYPDKGESGSTAGLDDATLFIRNIEAVCTNREELEEQIWITILHETAHFFGLEDEDLEAMGLG